MGSPSVYREKDHGLSPPSTQPARPPMSEKHQSSTNLHGHPHHHHHPQQHTPVNTKPTARNTPMLSFQPHHTEISTDRPSVSGRLLLHIPKLAGKRFHFVSLALHLRLKEAIAWTRQDLVTFEIEKQSWHQTVWDKKIMLAFQDKQVEEMISPVAAAQGGTGAETSGAGEGALNANVAAAAAGGWTPSVNNTTKIITLKDSRTGSRMAEIAADEWRWEWLMPVTQYEVRPESFEGSMGTVWYELEAKCLFRWEDVLDPSGQPSVVEGVSSSVSGGDTKHLVGYGLGKVQSGSTALMKGIEGSTNKAKSLAHAFGKLRVGGSKSHKNLQPAGDFRVGNAHEEYIKNSLRKRDQEAAAANRHQNINEDPNSSARKPLLQSSKGHTSATSPQSSSAEDQMPAEPLPFLIRKVLKLYFIKPPPSTSSNPAFFLPPPSMALPTLPGTRRLKAIIPGAKIQVQIQIPSLIPIQGYALTSQLVPDSKKGGLVLAKPGSHQLLHQQQLSTHHHHDHHHHHHHHSHQQHGLFEIDSRSLDNFQVALTVRKVTPQDLKKSDGLRKRYENAEEEGVAAAESQGPRKRLLSDHNLSSSNLNTQYEASGNNPHPPLSATRKNSAQEKRPWRKEIRVRKVKCEFWQKESCRIPTSEAPTRTIKLPLGPAFTYSEKEQERERSRSSFQLLPLPLPSMPATSSLAAMSQYQPQQQQQPQQQASPLQPPVMTSALSWDPSVAGGSGTPALASAATATPGTEGGDGLQIPTRKDSVSNLTMPLSPKLKHQSITPTSPRQTPTTLPGGTGARKGSTASLSTPSLLTHPPISKTGMPGTVSGHGGGGAGSLQSHVRSLSSSNIVYPSTPLSHSLHHGPHHLNNNQKPFMLLIPVPLDSPKLRQTFSWPSAETPSPVPGSGYDPMAMAMMMMPSSAMGAPGAGASDYPSVKALYEMAMMGGVTGAQAAAAAAAASKSNTSSQTTEGLGHSDSILGVGGVDGAGASLSASRVSAGRHGISGSGSGVGGGHHHHHHHHHHGHGGGGAVSAGRADAIRTRIEVKHYLSIRLSIDMLEYEGEYEQEDLDLGAIEEQQLSLVRNRQELSAYGSQVGPASGLVVGGGNSGEMMLPGAGVRRPKGASISMGSSEQMHRDRPKTTATTVGARTGPSSSSSSRPIPTSSLGSGSSGSVSPQQQPPPPTSSSPSTLSFLNSATGVVDMELERNQQQQHERRPSRSNSASGALYAYDPSQRRGSKGSLGTVMSSTSGHSGTSTGGHSAHGGGGGGGGLMAGALGALKKKASASGLNAMLSGSGGHPHGGAASPMPSSPLQNQYQQQQQVPQQVPPQPQHPYHHQQHHPHHHHHHHHHPRSVSVKKLKDFVIRVPITVVVQVNDVSRIGTSLDNMTENTATNSAATVITYGGGGEGGSPGGSSGVGGNASSSATDSMGSSGGSGGVMVTNLNPPMMTPPAASGLGAVVPSSSIAGNMTRRKEDDKEEEDKEEGALSLMEVSGDSSKASSMTGKSSLAMASVKTGREGIEEEGEEDEGEFEYVEGEFMADV